MTSIGRLAPGTLASPCVGVCRIDRDRGDCLGCRRTLDEIGAWRDLDDAARQRVLDRAAERRVAHGSEPGPPPGERRERNRPR